MAKEKNLVDSTTLRITISVQSEALLEQLGLMGIYGRNAAEVATRFIDEALQRYVEQPKMTIKQIPAKARGKKK